MTDTLYEVIPPPVKVWNWRDALPMTIKSVHDEAMLTLTLGRPDRWHGYWDEVIVTSTALTYYHVPIKTYFGISAFHIHACETLAEIREFLANEAQTVYRRYGLKQKREGEP